MNITKTQFRWLVTASLIAAIGSAVVSFALESRLPPPLRDYVIAQEEAPFTTQDVAILIVGILLLIVWIISIIGLYCFWPIARPLTVFAWLAMLVLQMFMGLSIDFAVTQSFVELDALLGGIIIAVIYLSPAAVWFDKPPAA